MFSSSTKITKKERTEIEININKKLYLNKQMNE